MKAMIVAVSVSHGHTKRIADIMGDVLDAAVVAPEQVDLAELAACDIVGFGSGIFYGKFHQRLRDFVQSLPQVRRQKAFVLATSGLPDARIRPFIRPFARTLEQKGFEVADTFSCRAFDTWLPFKLVGGIHKHRPNVTDLQAARTFAEGLRARVLT